MTRGSVHLRDGLDLKRMMIVVVIALMPIVFMAMYNTGLQANQAMAGVRRAPQRAGMNRIVQMD